VRGRVEAHILHAEVEQLLAAGGGVVEHAEQNGVPAPGGGGGVWLGEDGAEVSGFEVADRLAGESPRRHREDALHGEQVVGSFALHVPRERVDRRQALVARTWATSPLGLQVLEERNDRRRVEVVMVIFSTGISRTSRRYLSSRTNVSRYERIVFGLALR
jgi:hypothetical protein